MNRSKRYYSCFTISWGLLIIALLSSCSNFSNYPQPKDTLVKADMEEGNKKARKLNWLDDIHQSSDAVRWQDLESQTAWDKHIQRRTQQMVRNREEPVANGQLVGVWKEGGSVNQAGSILATAYDAEQSRLYAISAGGNLWRGTLDGQWQVINQDLRFSGTFLEIIAGSKGKRMFAMINKIIHFSDDFGQSWHSSDGLETIDNWGQRGELFHIMEAGEPILYQRILHWDQSKQVTIYRSDDFGQQFQPIHQLGNTDFSQSRLVKPIHTEHLYLSEIDGEKLLIYQIDPNQNALILKGEDNLRLPNIQDIEAFQENDYIHWLTYDRANNLHHSLDFGNHWTFRSHLPMTPWRGGLSISPSNHKHMLFGEVEAYRSTDGGIGWRRINSWGAYYSDIENNLHADIMEIKEYTTSDGKPFTIIANHGGISISYDYGRTNKNIGLTGLNVSQYYAVRTDPKNPSVIYAGSQDQGLQRTRDGHQEGLMQFEQIISGDYGHLIFTKNKHLWAVYPDGWVTFYQDPAEHGYFGDFQLPYFDQSAWLPPLIPSQANENVAYLLGGSLSNPDGSHIIKLNYRNGQISAEELPFDFRDYSLDGYLSAMAISPFEHNTWYAATSNGYLLVSHDRGTNWEQSIINVPEPHYLYGSTILCSHVHDGHIYVAGSGYSGPGMLFSDNFGQLFEAVGTGLPPTTILDLAMNEDESLIFAATEAGPYLFNVETQTWSDMSGLAAPNTTYWSVEYLAAQEIVRFGTYGRGIFDFHINSISTSREVHAIESIQIYPNPVQSVLQVQIPENNHDVFQYSIVGINGQSYATGVFAGTLYQINVDYLPPGIFYLNVNAESRKEMESMKFIKI